MNDPIPILIRGHEAALELVLKQPGHFDVVYITSPSLPFIVTGSEAILDKGRSTIMVQFDDVDGPMEGFVPPRREHIAAVLDWSKDKSNFLISCRAGISRSSAMAVVILASRVPVPESLVVLDPAVHHPNPLVVQFGEEILGKAGLAEAVSEWKRFRQPL
jgi:predicted protein tyrosine phosphatase